LEAEISNQIDKGVDFAINKTKQVAAEKIMGFQNGGGSAQVYAEEAILVCPNCQADVPGSSSFCGKCGANVSAAQTSAVAVYDAQSNNLVTADEVAQIESVMDLQNMLTKIQDAQDADSALACSIEAQLQVISVLNSPEMASSPLDNMIQQLEGAVKAAESEEQKKDIQMRASLMATNMVFFMEAKLRYFEDKHSKAGKDLLKNGCNLLAQSAVGIIVPGASRVYRYRNGYDGFD